MREIVLDTETTGLDPSTGDRIVEIGCVEIFDGIPTGKTFHRYINPERDVPEGAFRVHGLSAEFLGDKPKFATIVDEWLAFIEQSRLVIHNAEFDMRFINSELVRAGRTGIGMDRVLDTLLLARRKHPGMPNSLDALCARYSIDNSRRTKHGALLDSEILAEVYIELTGGHQRALSLTQDVNNGRRKGRPLLTTRPSPLPAAFSEPERHAHETFIGELGEKGLWRKYLPPGNIVPSKAR